MQANDYNYDAIRLAELIAKRRGNRSFEDIAKELQIGKTTIWRMEQGKNQPDFSTFMVICTWLGVDPCEFFLKKDNSSDDELAAQFRALPTMSTETAAALMAAVKAMYEEIHARNNQSEAV